MATRIPKVRNYNEEFKLLLARNKLKLIGRMDEFHLYQTSDNANVVARLGTSLQDQEINDFNINEIIRIYSDVVGINPLSWYSFTKEELENLYAGKIHYIKTIATTRINPEGSLASITKEVFPLKLKKGEYKYIRYSIHNGQLFIKISVPQPDDNSYTFYQGYLIASDGTI